LEVTLANNSLSNVGSIISKGKSHEISKRGAHKRSLLDMDWRECCSKLCSGPEAEYRGDLGR
jgi:hypothetical protein